MCSVRPIHIPIEVVEHVLDIVSNDAESLSNCALVCRQWLPRAHFLRFVDVALPVSSLKTSTRHGQFDHLLVQNPALVAFVQSLTFAGTEPFGHHMRWTEGASHLCTKLSAIRELALSRIEFTTSLTDLVPTLCALPLLESLSLDRVRVTRPALAPDSLPSLPDEKPHARRALQSFACSGGPIGESVCERESTAFANALLDVGLLAPSSLRSLSLLSGARGCSGWLSFFPIIAPALRHCALSLHELVTPAGSSELTDDARNDILRTYEALSACVALRSLHVRYNTTSTLVDCAFEGLTETVPSMAPFILDALCATLSSPGGLPSSFLKELVIDIVGSCEGPVACRQAFSRLAHLLEDRKAYPMFRRLEITIGEPKDVMRLFKSRAATEEAEVDRMKRDLLDVFGQITFNVDVVVYSV